MLPEPGEIGSISHQDGPRYFELSFESAADSQATRAVLAPQPGEACLEYDADEARLVLISGGERHELAIRAQAHKLVRYMAERSPALCTHEELMRRPGLYNELYTLQAKAYAV